MIPHISPEAPFKEKYKTIFLAVGVAVGLMIMKFAVGLFTGSLSLIASAVDSLTDVFVSTVNLISVRQADKPADSEHLYGHGKIESLAGLFQSILIAVSGGYLVIEAARRLINGFELDHIYSAIAVMIVSMAVTFILVMRLKKVQTQTQSIIVKTEMVHYTMDFLTNGGIILALILVKWTGKSAWDLLIAFGISIYILKEAVSIFKCSVDELLDKAFTLKEQKELETIIVNFNPKIVGFHNLRTRKIGQTRFIDFHVEIAKEDSFKRAHDLTELLVKRIQQDFPDADVTIHYDPEGAF